MEELNGYFKQVVKDAIHDLKKGNAAYLFFREQVEVILDLFPDATVKENDGIYTISVPRKKKGGTEK